MIILSSGDVFYLTSVVSLEVVCSIVVIELVLLFRIIN